MIYIFGIALFIIILNIGIMLCNSVRNKTISANMVKIILITTLIALAVVAYCIEPKQHNDLYRHFEVVDTFRNEGFVNVADYDSLIGTKILFFIIAILPNNHFLPAIAAVITYGIGFFIIYDFNKNQTVGSRTLLISVLMIFTMTTYATVVGRIRNAMAFAFLALALYYDLIRNEKKIKIIPFYLIAISIHPSSFMVIAVRLLLSVIDKIKSKCKIKGVENLKYVMLGWSAIIPVIIKILNIINTPFTQNISSKLVGYSLRSIVDDIRLFLVYIAILVFVYIISEIIRRQKDVPFEKYIYFIQLYIIIIFGSILIDKLFVRRLIIVLAFFMIPLIHMIEQKIKGKYKLAIYLLFIFFAVGLIAYSVVEVKSNMSFIFLNN